MDEYEGAQEKFYSQHDLNRNTSIKKDKEEEDDIQSNRKYDDNIEMDDMHEVKAKVKEVRSTRQSNFNILSEGKCIRF